MWDDATLYEGLRKSNREDNERYLDDNSDYSDNDDQDKNNDEINRAGKKLY